MKPPVQLLRELIDYAHGCEEEPRWQSSMEDMLDRHTRGLLSSFTLRQKQYIAETHEKVFDQPQYENAFSAGKVPLGEPFRTPIPDVLRKPLPMKPPGRK